MSYSASIPNASDPRAISQIQIQANYQAINTTWAVNHNSLVGNDVPGRHRVLTIRQQSGNPTTSASQVALYNKDVSTIPQLFFRRSSNGNVIQLTYTSLQDTGDQQYSFIAGPFLVYGGVLSNVTQAQLVTLSPTTTLKYVGVIGSGISGTLKTTQVVATDLSGSTFKIRFQAGLTSPIPKVYYIAIGQP